MLKSTLTFLLLVILFSNPLKAFSQPAQMRKLQTSLPKIKDSIAYVDALNRLARFSEGLYTDSIRYYAEKAYKIAVRIRYKKGSGQALTNLGTSYKAVNNHLATKYFRQALEIFESINDKEGICYVLVCLGESYDDDETRKKYVIQSLNLSSRLEKDSIRSIIVVNYLALLDLEDPQYMRLYSEGRKIAEKYNDKGVLAQYQIIEARLLAHAGKNKEALNVLLRSEKQEIKDGFPQSMVNLYVELATVLIKEKKPAEEVNHYLKKIADTADKYGDSPNSIMIVDVLRRRYKAKGEEKQAYYYADKLISKYKQMKIAEEKSGYVYLNFVNHELEVEHLKKEDLLKKRMLFLLGSLLILAIGISFFIYRSLVIKRKYNKTLRKLHEISETHNIELQHKDDFNKMLIAVIAHDIRQPFSAIVMLSGVYNDQVNLLSEQKKIGIMKDLENISQRSIHFMDGLLEWIKSQKESFKYHQEKLNLKAIVSESNVFFTPSQAKKNIHLVLDVPDHIYISANRQMLLFIIRNILNNATKYSPTEEIISVSTTVEQEHVVLAIKDRGHGMSQQELDELFTARSNHRDLTKNDGAGVALSISYEMADIMGASIYATSIEKKGTTFHLSMGIN